MALVFHRGLVIPLSAIVFCAIALSGLPRLMPSLIALLGVAVIATAMLMIVRRLRPPRPVVDVFPAVNEDADAADLVRMDDDGGGQTARQPPLTDDPRQRHRTNHV